MNAADQELIRQLLSNQIGIAHKAWELLYATYYPMVNDFICKNDGTAHDARDIFQDAVLVFDQNLRNGRFRGQSSTKTYLYGICKNLWHTEFRKKQKQLDAEASSLIVSEQDVNYLIHVEVITLLMNELKEDCRKTLTEYYFNKRSMAELKEMFSVGSIQAAKNKKWRCLSYLERLFKEKSATASQRL